LLLVVAGCAFLLGASYQAPNVLLLGGAYGTTGSISLLSNAVG